MLGLLTMLAGVGGAAFYAADDLGLRTARLPSCDSATTETRMSHWLESVPAVMGTANAAVQIEEIQAIVPAADVRDPESRSCVAEVSVGREKRQVRFDIVRAKPNESFAVQIVTQ